MIGHGLKPLPRKNPGETADYSLSGVFGIPPRSDIPNETILYSSPLEIKDQQYLDDCTGNAVTEVSEDQEGTELSEEYQFYLTKVLIENDPISAGANLRDACLSAVEYGSIPKSIAYLYLHDRYSRSAILDPNTWPSSLLGTAAQHAKGSMFAVDYPYDIFTNIRAALWDHREEKTGSRMSVVVGCNWYAEWTGALAGVIPKEYGTLEGGHAFKIYGQKVIDGEIHLVAQLSNNTSIGDSGIFYFPASVVNAEFKGFGQFMFNDMPKEKAKFYLDNGISIRDNWIVQFYKIVLTLFKSKSHA